jgi:hypothetical protein
VTEKLPQKYGNSTLSGFCGRAIEQKQPERKLVTFLGLVDRQTVRILN